METIRTWSHVVVLAQQIDLSPTVVTLGSSLIAVKKLEKKLGIDLTTPVAAGSKL